MSQLLIVDADRKRAARLEQSLRAAGFPNVRTVHDARHALPALYETKPDLILLDLLLPLIDGVTVLQQLLSRVSEPEALPVLVVNGDVEPALRKRVLEVGATEFLPADYDDGELALRVRNLLRVRSLHDRLDQHVKARTALLETAEVEIAKRLAFVAEIRDYPDGAHPSRVGRMAASIGAELGLLHDEVELIRLAAPLHDIGKLSLPDSILMKPGKLTAEEFEIVKSHTTIGGKMLTGTSSWILQAAEEVALYHHEAWDGSGYTGLAGETIPVIGRITSVSDVFDALLHKRSYKPAWKVDDALNFIRAQSGRKFDPAVVDAFERVIAREYPGKNGDEWQSFMTSVAESIEETFASAFDRAMRE
jgi:putative two-component system response regulator